MKMQKLTAFLLAIVLIFTLCSCGKEAAVESSTVESQVEESVVESSEVEEEQPFADCVWANKNQFELNEDAPVKNVILIIGDGMGVNHLESARIVKGDALACDCMPHTVMVSTCNVEGTVTDSAASATAMATGVKTVNKAIGVDKDGNEVPNLGEFFKGMGMRVGTVVTQIVPHATPAGFFAHNQYRDNYGDLFADMLKLNMDVIFGGGQGNLDYNGKEIVAQNGYTYITKAAEMDSLQNGTKALGLFRYSDMAGGVEPDLATMTGKALELLENDKGFFLMVEASHIDAYASGCDIEGTMLEMSVFDRAVETALEYASTHEGTLVLVTADHETGGLTLPENATIADLTNDCFTSGGEHTGADVMLYAAGAGCKDIFKEDRIENTQIHDIIVGFFSMP